MKIQPLIVATILAVLFTGCAGTSPTRLIADTIGVAGGALLGSTLGKRNSLASAAGAGAGLLLSESLHAGSTAAANKSYAAGYEKGRSDSAKQQYQALNERQRISPQLDDAPDVRLLEVPLPEREENGVILAPGTATLRLQE